MRAWLCLVLALSLLTASAAGADTGSTRITLNPPVHVIGLEGEDVVLGPGDYDVELLTEGGLRFLPLAGGDALRVSGAETSHEESIDAPEVLSFTEEGIFRIVLLLPDGRAVHTEASLSPMRERGARALGASTLSRQRKARSSGRRKASVPRPSEPPAPAGSGPVNAVPDSTIARIEHVTVGAAAFVPRQPPRDAYRSGDRLHPYGFGPWVAPVTLPDGARIVGLRALLHDVSEAGDASVRLMRTKMVERTGGLLLDTRAIANIKSSGVSASGWNSSRAWIGTQNVTDEVVDNRSHWYFLQAYFPAQSAEGDFGSSQPSFRNGVELNVVHIDYTLPK